MYSKTEIPLKAVLEGWLVANNLCEFSPLDGTSLPLSFNSFAPKHSTVFFMAEQLPFLPKSWLSCNNVNCLFNLKLHVVQQEKNTFCGKETNQKILAY